MLVWHEATLTTIFLAGFMFRSSFVFLKMLIQAAVSSRRTWSLDGAMKAACQSSLPGLSSSDSGSPVATNADSGVGMDLFLFQQVRATCPGYPHT